MEIAGIGLDIVEIPRLRKIIEETPGFIKRVFTESEVKYCSQKHDHISCLALRFAAKEAIFKALSTGLNGFSWQMIEIVSDNGKPQVILYSDLRQHVQNVGIETFEISLTTSDNIAAAVAIAIKIK
ncbi:MAG: holo-ACP synthase [Actinobacteria bacterium]|nr:holo-ACP synthase [Actinomycetota bacterium]